MWLWFSDHYTMSDPNRDFKGHMCVRFGRVRRLYIWHVNQPDTVQLVPKEKFEAVFTQNSWLNAMEALNEPT